MKLAGIGLPASTEGGSSPATPSLALSLEKPPPVVLPVCRRRRLSDIIRGRAAAYLTGPRGAIVVFGELATDAVSPMDAFPGPDSRVADAENESVAPPTLSNGKVVPATSSGRTSMASD